MEKIKSFAKEHIKEIIKIVAIIFVLIILAIIFYSYPVNLTWDSTEYIGLASYIGTDKMQTNWIGHRGIGFPLLIKLSELLGKNSASILTIMFIFYIVMIATFYFVYKKLYKLGYLKNIFLALLFAGYVFITIVFNPELFGYYHTVLTEFVAITFTILMCFLTWIWKDYKWKENKKNIIIDAIAFTVIIILLYHVKQSLVVFALIPLIVATIISIFNDFSYSNILYKFVTYIFIGVMFLFSIKAWGNYMTFSKFNVIQILKYVLVFIAIASLFALISYFCIKLTRKHKLEKIVSNVLKYGTLIIIFSICILGYNYYKYDEKPAYACDLSIDEQMEYNKIYSEKFAELEEKNIKTQNLKAEFKEAEQGMDVLSIMNASRVEGQLINGALSHIVAFESNFAELSAYDELVAPIVPRTAISYQDNYKIDIILNGYGNEGDTFTVYMLPKSQRYFVYFFNVNRSNLLNQLNCYFELLANYPDEIFENYRENFFKMIYVREDEFSPFDRENYNIPSKIYLTGIRNVVDSNPEYELLAKDYIYDIKENFVNKNLNWYMNKAIFVLLYKTETALWYMPIILSAVIILYLILRIFFNKKIKQEKIKLLEFIIILFTTSFGGMMSYIAFGMNIERYAIPAVIPVLTAYFLIGLFLLDLIIILVKSTHKKLKQKLYNKVT